MVVLLGNRILCRKPQILFCVQGILETCMCKAADWLVRIVNPLNDSRIRKVVNQLPCLCPIRCRKHQLCLSRTRNLYLGILIDIPIRMSRKRNRFFPVPYTRFDALDDNRCPEYRAVKHRPDCSVRALPHLLEVVLRHTRGIGRDCGALYCHTVFFRRLRWVHRNLVICLIAVLKTKVIIFRL